MKTNCSILILFIGISLLLFSSCNSVKYVADNEYLLTENTIIVNDKKESNNDIKDYIIQRPNNRVLSIPLGLNFYNLGNKDYISSYEIWKDSFPRREKTMTNIFSEKQSRAYRNSRYNFNNWFFKKGDAPVILDSLKTKLTAEKLKYAYIYKGYFRTQIDYSQILSDNKKASVEYSITSDKVFHIDTIETDIKSPILDSIFQKHKDESLIKTGIEFNFDYFEEEADRITDLFRNSGSYHFNRNAIGFEGDSTSNTYKSDIKMTINDRIIEKDDSIYTKPFNIQKISRVNIFTDYTYRRKDDPYLNNEEYNGYIFQNHDKLKYNPKLFSNLIFVEPNSIYSDINTDLTRRNLRRLKNFRLVNIKYNEIDSANLEADILLSPFKKFSLAADTELTHSNIKQLGVSGKIYLITRNIFRDASNFQFSVQGSFFNSTDASAQAENAFFNAYEFGADISLEVPRILFPGNIDKWIPKKMLPKTQFTFGPSFQKNIGLDKQKFTSIINYNWESTNTRSHRIEIFNTQFINNLNVDAYFDVYKSEYDKLVDVEEEISKTTTIPPDLYDENGDIIPEPFAVWVLLPANGFEESHPDQYQDTQNVAKQRNILTENVVVPLVSYEFTYNNRENFEDPNYSFFRGRIASAGVVAVALASEENSKEQKEIFDIPIAQFLKFDLEYKKFWGNSMDHVLAFRSFLGIAIPYGNSTDMPFSRSYFAGGANDIRAWQVYELGPGGTNTGLEYNVGTLKILTNLEYRFKVISKLNGALFIDAGNIWDITDSDLVEEKGKFTSFSSLENTALGTGFGARYDFSFLVIRLDVGFKTYEPYLDDGDKWFSNYNFGHAVYNFGINYPF